MIFRDRVDAGQQLAERLEEYRGKDCIVMAIPRGGVVTGEVVAAALDAPLDVIVPRKLGAPQEPELAIGAVVTWGDGLTIDEPTTRYLRVTQEYIENEARAQIQEVNRRLQAYRGTTEPPNLEGKIALLIDDGIATGQTMLAAVKGVRSLHPAKVVVAAPVASGEALRLIGPEVDDLVCLSMPVPFLAVGQWYEEFGQVSDEQVVEILRRRADSFQSKAA